MSTHLFIGGPVDGQFIEVPCADRCFHAVAECTGPRTAENHSYTRETLTNGGPVQWERRWTVFVHSKTPLSRAVALDAIRRLLLHD